MEKKPGFSRSHFIETRRPGERAGPLTYLLFLFQELTMNKFKLSWGLMTGILPRDITRQEV
jgi:hypothetical protein